MYTEPGFSFDTFSLWDKKKSKTKANTIIQKSKLVSFHSKFILWASSGLWVDFSYYNSVPMARDLLLLIAIFFKDQKLP